MCVTFYSLKLRDYCPQKFLFFFLVGSWMIAHKCIKATQKKKKKGLNYLGIFLSLKLPKISYQKKNPKKMGQQRLIFGPRLWSEQQNGPNPQFIYCTGTFLLNGSVPFKLKFRFTNFLSLSLSYTVVDRRAWRWKNMMKKRNSN